MTLRGGKKLPEPQLPASKGKGKEVETPQSSSKQQTVQREEKLDYNVLGHLRKIPSLLSVYDTLMLSKELSKGNSDNVSLPG